MLFFDDLKLYKNIFSKNISLFGIFLIQTHLLITFMSTYLLP